MTPHQALKKYFGYTSFRPSQEQIITSVLANKDTFAILPTGHGKSLCFQVPGLIFPNLTIVISPLISLMKDQVDALKARSIRAELLNSTLTKEKKKHILELITIKKLTFVYTTPEQLQNHTFQKIFKTIKVSQLVIDEAHCISEWGHDFRPSYTLIHKFIACLPSRPTISAFTATATEYTIKDAVNSLALIHPNIFHTNHIRTNLELRFITCKKKNDKLFWLLALSKKHQKDSGIIYTATRKEAKRLCAFFQRVQPEIPTETYHGGMNTEERNQVQQLFIHNKLQRIIATNAFGMGIDKADIRYVVHYQLPGSIEHYSQETGRAGRDGKHSFCYLLYYRQDLKIQLELLKRSKQKYHQLKKLSALTDLTTTHKCKNIFLSKYFSIQDSRKKCQNCSSCYRNSSQYYWEIDKDIEQHITQLAQLRNTLTKKYTQKPATILTNEQLHLLALITPRTLGAYQIIPSFGKSWIEQWGQFFVGETQHLAVTRDD